MELDFVRKVFGISGFCVLLPVRNQWLNSKKPDYTFFYQRIFWQWIGTVCLMAFKYFASSPDKKKNRVRNTLCQSICFSIDSVSCILSFITLKNLQQSCKTIEVLAEVSVLFVIRFNRIFAFTLHIKSQLEHAFLRAYPQVFPEPIFTLHFSFNFYQFSRSVTSFRIWFQIAFLQLNFEQ